MKKILTLLGLLSSLWTYGQNLTRIEYYIDSDPGLGSGTALSFTTSSVVSNVNASVDLTSVSSGTHVLYLRAKDANNKWSFPASRPFVKFGTSIQQNVTRLEYYIDSDPGLGNATAVSFTASTVVSNVNVAVDLSTVSSGTHVIYMRAKDAQGSWSFVASRPFVKFATSIPQNIVRIEYFFDTDPGNGKGITAANLTPSTVVSNLNITADISTLIGGNHTCFIRALDAQGNWSLLASKTFVNTIPVLSVSSSNLAFTTVGGTNVVTVSSNVAWSVAKSDSWLTVSTVSGINNGTLAITALPNTTLLGTITGFVTVSGSGISRIINVTQYSLPQSQIISLNPISNITLSGASQSVTISGSASSGLAVSYSIASNPSGIASLSGNVVTLSNVGTVTVTGTQVGNSNFLAANAVSSVFSVSTLVGTTTTTTSPVAQTITINPISNITLSGANQNVTISGSASSGLAVSYSIASNPSGIASLSGNVITLSNVGTVTVTGNQAGNSSYLAANAVSTVFSVSTLVGNVTTTTSPVAQSITLSPLSNVTLSGATQNVTISGSASSGLAVSYSIVSNPSGIASLSGNVITLSNVGTVTVTGNQAGNSSYLAANAVSSVFSVSTLVGTVTTTTSPVAQTITFGNLSTITISGASQIINLSATASSGLAVSYTLTTNPAGIASLSNNQLTVSNVGTVSVTASQSGNSAFLAASSVTQSFSVVTLAGGGSTTTTGGTNTSTSGSNVATVSGLQVSNVLSNTANPIKVTVSGTNITSGATATVGGVALTNVSVIGTNALVGTIPAGSTVTNPNSPSVAVQNAGTVASTSTNVIPAVTDVLDGIAETVFSIYPNPNTGSFTISSKSVTSFQIYSLEGALLQIGNLTEGENTIITHLNTGFYLIRVGNGVKKLLVE